MYGVELAIIIWATLSCTLVSSSPSINSAGLMIFWRVIMGVGVGGDYPLSSVITAEFAPTRWRGAMVGAVFSMQGLGQLMAAIVSLIMTVGFEDAYRSIADETVCDSACRLAADRSWRIIVGVGAIPACLALYYRITIPETPRYTFDVRLDVEKADADIRAYVSSKTSGEVDVTQVPVSYRLTAPSLNVPQASWSDLVAYFGQWKNLRVLLGTSFSWFFLDLAFYGLGLNTTIVLHAIGYADGDTLYEKLHNQAVGMVILSCAGSIPGYWAAVFTIDSFGRKPLQIGGFALLTILFAVIGFRLHDLSETALLVLYVVAQFLFNAGPNTTTFIVAGECFPTRYRSTGHGISAAMGKLGAIIAQVISIPILKRGSREGCEGNDCSPYLDHLLQLFALFMLLGTLTSLLIPETKGLTLEELSGETRTSYNAGCNGSISLGSPRRRAWNPFGGGQPAGFFYPHERTASASISKGGAPSSRVGIMTSQSSMVDDAHRRRSRFWRRRRRGARRESDATNDIALHDRTSAYGGSRQGPLSEATGGGGGGDGGPVESEPQGEPAPTSRRRQKQKERQQEQRPAQQELPLWGAGWGRVDRGRPMIQMDEVQLHDVGSLLRSS